MQASIFTATANVTGYFCLYLAVFMLLPMIADLVDGNAGWQVFAISSVLVSGVSLFVIATTQGYMVRFTPRFGLVLLNVLWLSTCIVGALPIYFSPIEISLAGAAFESVSGLTTTGGTVLVGLDTMPPGFLLWRSILHWLGGIGVVATGLLLLPFLNVGGMQFFRLESSGPTESPFPRFRQFSIALISFYVAITALCTLGFIASGMSTFDAVNHAMSAVSTGGFSTRDSSMREFGEAALVVGTVFMFLGALPFVVLIRAIVQRNLRLALDPQIPVFLAIILVATALVSTVAGDDFDGDRLRAFNHALFNVVSLITTTGFVASDYDLWGPFSIGVFFILMFFGGCSGSTSGGIKIYRIIVLFESLRVTLRQMMRPNVVTPLRYGKQSLGPDVAQSVLVFIGVYFAIFLLTSLSLTATGLDFETSVSGAITTLGNTGPGFGTIIGPAGSFRDVSETAKWILSFAMLLGRLEVMSVLILFSPTFWRNF